MKKFFKSVLTAALIVCVCFAFFACKEKDPPHTHELREVAAREAECVKEGNKAYYVCDGCGKWFADADGNVEITDKDTVKTEPLNHDWDDGNTVPASCTEDGVTTYSCKRNGCGETRKEYSDKLGHDLSDEWTQGVHTHYHACSRCDLHSNEAEHSYSDSDDSVCKVCGSIDYDTAFTFSGRKADGTKTTVESEIASYAVSEYEGSRKRVIIPLTYNGKPVTEIAARTFSGNTSVTAVSVPRTVTLIGAEAFYNCTSLIDVELQGGVKKVGDSAFRGCSSLQNITFSGTISSLGNRAFQGTGIRTVHFPENLTSIGETVFAACKNLTEITIPSTVTSVGDSIFLQCTALETVNFLANVDAVGDMMFNSCTALKTVRLSSSVKSIGIYSFAYTAIENVDFLPEGLTTIGNKAFSGCSAIKTAKIPSSCTVIKPEAFRLNKGLETVTGGANVEEIGIFAFYGCDKLNSFPSMPKLTAIGDSAFYYCSRLTDFTFGSKLISVGEKAFQASAIGSVSLGDRVTTVGDYAFASNANLSSVTIGRGLETVGNYVFYACTRLSSVSCDSVVGYGMFWGDTSLLSVTIGSHATVIGGNAFNGCTGLTAVTFENTVGWSASVTDSESGETATVTPEISSGDAAANAALLTGTYCGYNWTRA